MTNYFTIGKKAILVAANAQLEMMNKAKSVVFATPDGSSYIFEIALQRIKEADLADKFIAYNPKINSIVGRESACDDILAAIISNLDRGNKEFALKIEKSQRRKFYIDNIGYLDPHFRGDTVDDHLRNKDYTHVYKDIKQKRESSKFWNKEDLEMFLSPAESIYALYVNLALGKRHHFKKISENIFNLFYNKESRIFKIGEEYREDWSTTSAILRALDLAGDKRGKELFYELKEKIMSDFQKAKIEKDGSYSVFAYFNLPPLAFTLSHFKRDNDLEIVMDAITEEIKKIKPTIKIKDNHDGVVYFGSDSFINAILIRLGLALTGLQKDKFNRFYTT